MDGICVCKLGFGWEWAKLHMSLSRTAFGEVSENGRSCICHVRGRLLGGIRPKDVWVGLPSFTCT